MSGWWWYMLGFATPCVLLVFISGVDEFAQRRGWWT